MIDSQKARDPAPPIAADAFHSKSQVSHNTEMQAAQLLLDTRIMLRQPNVDSDVPQHVRSKDRHEPSKQARFDTDYSGC